MNDTSAGGGPEQPAAHESDAVLGAVGRLEVMVSGIPGARIAADVVPGDFADVWLVMGDLEGGFGRFQPDMRDLRVTHREGERVTAYARSRFGFRARLHGVVRPGWCWLQSRFLVIGMAAEPLPDGTPGTRVALTGGVRVPGRAAIVPVGAERELHRALTRLRTELAATPAGGTDPTPYD
ncbi:hypothetical protein [Yinghuangia soli]|uniref:Uncharacterized protein n=1 Tax=Yinghuangia soli TaxID=2908204 RepID=A0AA41Q785_9ACTN|nr:hypothetical protein [Yinghuangia soli]MCF2531996.1 hypothetical protein [Yinghuangia soli]